MLRSLRYERSTKLLIFIPFIILFYILVTSADKIATLVNFTLHRQTLVCMVAMNFSIHQWVNFKGVAPPLTRGVPIQDFWLQPIADIFISNNADTDQPI